VCHARNRRDENEKRIGTRARKTMQRTLNRFHAVFIFWLELSDAIRWQDKRILIEIHWSSEKQGMSYVLFGAVVPV
jgi:hypothetical protein